MRHRLKESMPLKERLMMWAKQVREQAELLPAGQERDALLRKASQADTASDMDDWFNSPGLQPPTR
jgi:hypothetical protein